MLDIHDLKAGIDGKDILKGLSLKLGKGEAHALMGPNGSGTSTLSYILSGRSGSDIEGGSVTFEVADPLEQQFLPGRPSRVLSALPSLFTSFHKLHDLRVRVVKAHLHLP